jgi:hypothetical protein
MPCPVCYQPIGEADHRMCVYNLLKTGEIKSAAEWTKMSEDAPAAPAKPVTIYKGRVKAVLPKE